MAERKMFDKEPISKSPLRADELLQAAVDMLIAYSEDRELIAHYDYAICNFHCLIYNIKAYLENGE